MKVIFIPFSKDNPYQKDLAAALRKSGVEVISEIGFSCSFFTYTLFKLIINHWKPDILHIHWLDPYIYSHSRLKSLLKSFVFILDMLIIRMLGIKIIWTVHNLVVHDGKFVRLEYAIISLFASMCDGVIVHSESALDEVGRRYAVPAGITVVIPHGNYINTYSNNTSRAEARRKLGIPESEHVFLYFGKIRPYKGLEKLVEIFKSTDPANSRLIIAGKAPDLSVASDIKKSCAESQKIIPVISFIPDEEIQLYMNAADTVVLPYTNIFTSGSLLLAMSFGKAIIAPSTGSIPDILDHNGGFLYDPNDPSGLKKALENSFNHDLSAMGKYNYIQAGKYDWDNIARLTYSFYRKHAGHDSASVKS